MSLSYNSVNCLLYKTQGANKKFIVQTIIAQKQIQESFVYKYNGVHSRNENTKNDEKKKSAGCLMVEYYSNNSKYHVRDPHRDKR